MESPRQPRRPRGRPLNTRSPVLALHVDPATGIKDELTAEAKRTGISEREIAVEVLISRRGQYGLIADRLVERAQNKAAASA